MSHKVKQNKYNVTVRTPYLETYVPTYHVEAQDPEEAVRKARRRWRDESHWAMSKSGDRLSFQVKLRRKGAKQEFWF